MQVIPRYSTKSLSVCILFFSSLTTGIKISAVISPDIAAEREQKTGGYGERTAGRVEESRCRRLRRLSGLCEVTDSGVSLHGAGWQVVKHNDCYSHGCQRGRGAQSTLQKVLQIQRILQTELKSNPRPPGASACSKTDTAHDAYLHVRSQ